MADDDPFGLARFIVAQGPVYARVVDELKASTKRSHWTWFIFPQLRGLGRSDAARRFGIASRGEAEAYLAHPLLSMRLAECTALMQAIEGRTLAEIMPFPDDLKFISSMTLFAACARDPAPFRAALEAYNGGVMDRATLDLLDDGAREAGSRC